jgi:hypothetical protein
MAIDVGSLDEYLTNSLHVERADAPGLGFVCPEVVAQQVPYWPWMPKTRTLRPFPSVRFRSATSKFLDAYCGKLSRRGGIWRIVDLPEPTVGN